MNNLYKIIVLFAVFTLIGCSHGMQAGSQTKQVRLVKDNQGSYEILGVAKGQASITKFMFFTFGDKHLYASSSRTIRGLVEREAIHNTLENFSGADGLLSPEIITTVDEFLFYAKYHSTVAAKAVKINPSNQKRSSFTDLWTFN